MTKDSIIYGIHAIQEAIQSGEDIDKIFIQMGLHGEGFKQLNKLIQKHNITNSYVPLEKLDHMTKYKNHQGVVARMSPITYRDFEPLVNDIFETVDQPLFLLLDGITDTRNFGAIIRTAACSGVHAIIIPKTGSAPLSADGIKTSAGAAFQVPISKVNHIKDAVYYLQASGIQIVGITEKSESNLYDLSFNKPTALIMGSEERGINPSVLNLCDATGKIPLLGDIDSLNVSVACGVALYEVVRQRL